MMVNLFSLSLSLSLSRGLVVNVTDQVTHIFHYLKDVIFNLKVTLCPGLTCGTLLCTSGGSTAASSVAVVTVVGGEGTVVIGFSLH